MVRVSFRPVAMLQHLRHCWIDATSFGFISRAPELCISWSCTRRSSHFACHATQPREIPWFLMRRTAFWRNASARRSFSSA